jgi:WD40 repeat protein
LSLPQSGEPGVAAPIPCLAFSPDGRYAAIAGSDRRNISLYDLATEREVRQFTAPAGVRELAFSPDGHALATSSHGEGVVVVFETATGLQRRTYTGAGAAVAALGFSPDGRLLAAGGLT